MHFIYPGFLFALSALAIPVIVHLFNFRKFKRIYFTNVKFLREIKQETQSKSKLKHLLVLLARMLAIAFLVLAFAQPFIPLTRSTNVGGEKVVSIFIDNSFSMDAQGNSGSLLEQAKKNATEIIAAYAPSDRFQLLTNDFEAKHQRLLNKDEFFAALQEVKSSASVKSISEILARQSDMLNSSVVKNKLAFLLSDFQKSNFNLNELKRDTTLNALLLPLKGNLKNNLYIDSCWFETPSRQINKAEVLNVRICNSSAIPMENVPIKLFLNSKQKALASFSVESNSISTVKLAFTCKEKGIQNAQLQLTDYPVTFDDSYYFSFVVAPEIAVMCINEEKENNSITTLFSNDSAFSIRNTYLKNIDYAALPKCDLLILNEVRTISSGLAQELNRFTSNGGSLLIFPAMEIDFDSYKKFLVEMHANYFVSLDTAASRVDKINFAHPIYADVFDKKNKKNENIDLPNVQRHYVLNTTSKSNLEYLLRMQNGDVFLGKNRVGNGQVFLSAVPLNSSFSNFTKHAMFVPSLYKIALNSVRTSKLFYTIGQAEEFNIPSSGLGKEEVYHLKNTAGNFEIIPEHKVEEGGIKLLLHNQVNVAGNYLLVADKDSLVGVGFNYDRKESKLICFEKEELEAQIAKAGFLNFSLLSGSAKDLTTSIRELNQGKRYWKWCIILVLFFLATEAALLRFLK